MTFRKRTALFSFILTFLVIWIHAVNASLIGLSPEQAAEAADGTYVYAVTGLSGGSLKLCYMTQKLLGSGLGQTAVPGFFVISAYLFFRNIGNFGRLTDFFLTKWKKRAFSLAVPFVIWNLFYYIIYIAAGRAEFSSAKLLEAAVLNSCNPVFWYLRELIILTALSPAVYFFIKNKYTAAFFIAMSFLAAAFYELFPFHIVNEDALTYYAFGAACSLHLSEVIEDGAEKHVRLWSAAAAAAAAGFAISEYAVCTASFGRYAVIGGSVAARLCGVIFIFSVISIAEGLYSGGSKGDAAEKPLPAFMNYNFFIYAAHYLEIRFFRLIMSAAGLPADITESAGYVFMPAVCIAAAVITGACLKRICPKLYGVITGGRGV